MRSSPCYRPRRRLGGSNGFHVRTNPSAATVDRLLFKPLRRGVSTIHHNLSLRLHSNSVLRWLLCFVQPQTSLLGIMGSPSSAPTSVKPGFSGGKSNTNDVAKFSTPVCRASAAAAGSLAGPSSSTSPAAAVPPKLRSVPASTAKSNPELTSSPKVPFSPGNDWCDPASMDFSLRMDLLMAKVDSPPDELQSFPETSTVPTCNRKIPPRELPTGSLRSEWKSCNQQATNVTTQYLSTPELGTRVDVTVYQAMGARA